MSERGLRGRVEAGFARWGRFVARRCRLVIAGALLAAVGASLPARHVVLDTHPENFLDRRHPERIEYDAFKDQFGMDEAVVIAIRSPALWSADFLGWLRSVHEALEARVPHLEEVRSLVNARHTRGEADQLIVGELLEDWPETPAEIARVRAFAEANPLYQNLLLRPDLGLTTVVVELSPYTASYDEGLGGFDDEEPEGEAAGDRFITGTERNAATRVVLDVLEEHARDDIEVHITGSPRIAERVIGLSRANMMRFTALSFVAITLVLALLFRRAAGIALPPLVSLLSVASTFGLAGARGLPLNVTVQLIPSLLLAVGVSSTVHLLVVFFQRLDEGDDRTEAIAAALGHSGLPVMMASVTTAGGLASFNAAELAALRDVGVLAPMGIGISLLLSFTLLPALLVALPIRPRRRGSTLARTGRLGRGLVRVGVAASGRPGAVVGGFALLVGVVGIGTTRLYYLFDPLSFLHPDDPVRISTDAVDLALKGTNTFELVIDTGVENGLHDPQLLAALDRLHAIAPELRGGRTGEIEVGKALSFVDILKEIHQALNENRPEFYTVPGERALAAQELLLFENSGSDDLEDLVDPQFSKARFTLRIPWVPPSDLGSFLPETEARFREILGPDVALGVTGLAAVMEVTQEAMRVGLIRAYGLALLIITPLMMLLIGSVRGGLVSMVPNLAPIVLVLGLMGWAGLELNIFTMMVGSIAIGLAVDDTIHFVHQFYRYRALQADARAAVRSTMETTGLALLTTSTVLGCGFIVFSFANMRSLEAFGLVTTLSIVLAFLADIVISPALLTLVSRGRGR